MLQNFVMPDLYPAAPEIFLLLMSFLVLFVDLIFGATHRWLAAMLTVVTLLGCAAITLVTSDGQTDADLQQHVRRRPAGRLPQVADLPRRDHDADLRSPVPGRSRPGQGRVLFAGALRHAGHDGDDLGGELPDHVPRSRTDVAFALRPGRHRPRQPALHRGGDEVLRARRAGLRPAALRHVDDLRRHRQPGTRRRGAGPVSGPFAQKPCWSSALSSSLPASPSNSAWCPSTCGFPMSITVRQRP